eukprot:TRINITY_DN494_c0_g1_i1.p1 TRINITY_DN494_c0_g1~~TRINITY_DN494_c0_g1_i1.p1  ORF type:complete len:369 (+),score=93.77 TRINITY_DN494_c0_g1_i1:139-1245(+)
MQAPHGLSEQEVADAKAMFQKYDANGDGVLSREEFLPVVEALLEKNGSLERRGHKLSPAVVERMASIHFDEIDADKSGTIDIKEFLVLYAGMRRDVKQKIDQDNVAELQQTQVIRATDDATYEIHYLEAPLFKAKFGDALAAANAYHGGISLINKADASDVFELEFTADISVFGSLAPQVEVTATGPELVWQNQASAHIKKELTPNYWTKDAVVGSVTGAVANKYFDWVRQYNKDNGYYALWQLLASPSDAPFYSSHNCVDWVDQSFNTLKSLGATFDPVVRQRNYISLFTNEPTLVDYNDPATKAKIFEYFGTLKAAMAARPEDPVSALKFAEVLQQKFAQTGVYVYMRDKYYHLDLVAPLFHFGYM